MKSKYLLILVVMVWLINATPLFSFSQISNTDKYNFDCKKDCKRYYTLLKQLWNKDTTDSIFRYKPFSHGNRTEKNQFWKLIFNYPKCCVEELSITSVISLLGKPDAIFRNDKYFDYCYFLEKASHQNYISKKLSVNDLNNLTSIVRVRFNCKTKKVIKLGTRL